MRASGTEEAVALTPPVTMTLEDNIASINDDVLVEVTPASILLRKRPVHKKGTDLYTPAGLAPPR